MLDTRPWRAVSQEMGTNDVIPACALAGRLETASSYGTGEGTHRKPEGLPELSRQSWEAEDTIPAGVFSQSTWKERVMHREWKIGLYMQVRKLPKAWKQRPKRIEGRIPDMPMGPRTLPVPTSQLRNLTIYGALHRSPRELSPQWHRESSPHSGLLWSCLINPCKDKTSQVM